MTKVLVVVAKVRMPRHHYNLKTGRHHLYRQLCQAFNCLLYFSKSSFKVDLCAPIAYYFKVETVATALDISLSVPLGNQRVRFP